MFDGGTVGFFAQHLAKSSACQAVNWQNGDLTTYTQDHWHTGFSTLLLDHYNGVYFSTGGEFEIGQTGAPGTPDFCTINYIFGFDSGQAVSDYLPQTGPLGAMNGCLFDPTTNAAGAFGGDVAALKLNIDFSDAGLLPGSLSLKFGDLAVCGLTSDTGLNGLSVRQFLGTVNAALGGLFVSYSIADLDAVATNLNGSFAAGMPSVWAQAHLVDGSCP